MPKPLVGHDELGLNGERAGTPPLALTAGEFVRIATRMLGPQADQFQQLADPRASRRPSGEPMQHQFAQHGTNGHAD